MAQVHGARLVDGKNVIIKILRPNIEKIVEQDLEVILLLTKMVINYWPEAKRLKPIEIILEIKKSLLSEIDLRREAANAIYIKRNFKDNKSLYIPTVYIDMTKKNVLIQERIYGVPVNNIDELQRLGVDLHILAKKGVEIFFTQVFKDRFFHADMHPGNIFIDTTNPKDPNFIVVDFGIIGTLSKFDQRYLAENFIAFFNRDYQKVAELHIQSGWLNQDASITDFANSLMMVCEPIFQKPLKDISFSETLFNLFEVAKEYNINIQPQLILLQKTLIYVESLGRKLDPNLDLWVTAKPFLETWMKEQLGLKNLFKNIYKELPYWLEKLPEVPNMVYLNLTESSKKQKICLNIENIEKLKSGSKLQFFMQGVITISVTIIAFKLLVA
jgi:ubiquinone biosynthesis protein